MRITKKNLIGASASSVTPAGVQMAKTPSTGKPDERREVTGVFKRGVILDAKRIVIDYDQWPDVEDDEGTISYKGIGRVASYECLVRNENGESGWVAAGAMNIATAAEV